MDDELVALLSRETYLPKAAMQRAIADPEAIAEPVLRLIATAADDPDLLSEEDGNLLYWGLHALAGARDARLLPPLLRFLRQDAETLEGLLGDAVTETIPLVLASAFDERQGHADLLCAFILDTALYDMVQYGAFQALAFLTRQGRIDREAARALLVRFDDARIAVEESASWAAWEATIAYLGLSELAPRVEAARRDGRIIDEFNDAEWFRKRLRQAASEPPDLSGFGPGYGTLDDPVAALSWTAKPSERSVKNPFKDVGRNDPCPCGSGRKFKKCCLNAAPPTEPLPGLH